MHKSTLYREFACKFLLSFDALRQRRSTIRIIWALYFIEHDNDPIVSSNKRHCLQRQDKRHRLYVEIQITSQRKQIANGHSGKTIMKTTTGNHKTFEVSRPGRWCPSQRRRYHPRTFWYPCFWHGRSAERQQRSGKRPQRSYQREQSRP